VLLVRWHVYASANHWPLAIEVAKALIFMLPNDEHAWTNYVNSLYFAGRIAQARDVAASVLGR
jgi:hypothetical protein